MLPLLSHNDGKEIDISFVYETPDGKITHKIKSISGYGVFEPPRPNEPNLPKKCNEQGYFQYDYTKFLTFAK